MVMMVLEMMAMVVVVLLAAHKSQLCPIVWGTVSLKELYIPFEVCDKDF